MEVLNDTLFDKQTREAIQMVNSNHEKALEESNKLSVLKVKMQQVLSRISGKTVKRTTIHFINDNNERYIIKTNNGELIGTIGINVPRLQSKIILVNNRPVFILYRDNVIYLKKDIMSNINETRVTADVLLEETVAASAAAEPIIESAQKIYELIDIRDYALLDLYITESMEKLIVNDDVESAQKVQRDAYIKAQVLYRNIIKIKNALASVTNLSEKHQELINQMDILYRQICEIFINVGLYELPKNDEELITRG